jgi:hypothetical protein
LLEPLQGNPRRYAALAIARRIAGFARFLHL